VGTFIVVEGASSAAEARRAIVESGLAARESWDGRIGTLCTGIVRTASDAERVVLAALSGADLVVDCRASREVTDDVCDDLRRLGCLDHRVAAQLMPVLDGDQRALLTAIAGGSSLGDAATALHLSRRTADRRIAAARATLGAASTPEAIMKAARLGLLDHTGDSADDG
jgi:DNA-binding NarL/FixJ family response regulator